MSKDATPAAVSAESAAPPANPEPPTAPQSGSGAHELPPLPLDTLSPQFTLRAVLTGMVLGGALSLCNIYAGLRIGMGFNMSITAVLLGCGFWGGLRHLSGQRVRTWGILENNINQTAASAGASVSSAGLAATIPALALITGQALKWHFLALWVFSVCLVGIVVAVGLRRQMIVVDKLPFPVGIATAEMLRELHTAARVAAARVLALASAAVVAAGLKLNEYIRGVKALALPGSVHGISLQSLTFAFDPTLLLYGVGGLIGFRAGLSLLVGAVLAYGVLAPPLINRGYLQLSVTQSLRSLPADVAFGPELVGLVSYNAGQHTLEWKGVMTAAQRAALLAASNDPLYQEAVQRLDTASHLTPPRPKYRDMLQWLLWPGVTLMVVSALVSVSFSWRSMLSAVTTLRRRPSGPPLPDTGEVGRNVFFASLLVALLLSAVLQIALFSIAWGAAIVGVLLSFVLALVAGRVSGETGLTPVGAMAKVSQLLLGALSPTQPALNLMAANVTSGSASQCAELLHDLKCGYLLGASPRLQVLAQIAGALSGALVGSAAYLVLVPNPAEQLFTTELPAPAVATVKAVADLFQSGWHILPLGAGIAMLIAVALGVVLPIVERLVPQRARVWIPSAPSLGFAFVFPASTSLSIFIGALVALALGKWCRNWTARFLIAICAGIVAGDTLTAVGTGLHRMLHG